MTYKMTKETKDTIDTAAKQHSKIEKWMTGELSYSDRSVATLEQGSFRQGADFGYHLAIRDVLKFLNSEDEFCWTDDWKVSEVSDTIEVKFLNKEEKS